MNLMIHTPHSLREVFRSSIIKGVTMEKYTKLTRSKITAGQKGGKGLKLAQANLLGVPYPLECGWKDKIIGKYISDSDYELFLELGRF